MVNSENTIMEFSFCYLHKWECKIYICDTLPFTALQVNTTMMTSAAKKSPLFVSHLRRRVRWQCTFSTGPGTCQERPDCASAHSRLRSPAGPENAPSPCSHAQTDPRQRTSDTHLGATTLYLQRAKTGTSLEFNERWLNHQSLKEAKLLLIF